MPCSMHLLPRGERSGGVKENYDKLSLKEQESGGSIRQLVHEVEMLSLEQCHTCLSRLLRRGLSSL
jgi:hypothetical protein